MNEEKKIAHSLATRILNFVSPYIPDHIAEECMEIINNETRELVSVKDNTKRNYAHTRIRWKEHTCNGGDEYDVIFKLNSKRNFLGYYEKDPKDDEIFFYCESMEEFEHLKEDDNGEDFVIVGCVLFTETL